MMTVRRIMPLAVVTVLIVAACGQAAGSAAGGGARGAGAAKVIPFAVFLEGLRSASYADYAGRPGTRVRSQQAFAEMQTFLLARYADVRVIRSYASGGAVFDCTRQTAPLAHQPQPAGIPAGAAGTPQVMVQAQTCPHGSVPVRRMTLSDLVRFPSLNQYLSKGPGGSGQLPPTGNS
jgi:hypothetical protein